MKKLKQLIHRIENFLLTMLLPALLLPMVVVGQTFTNTSPAVNAGQYSTTAAYTLQFKFKSDAGTHQNRTVTLFEIGNQKAYISYPYLVFNNVYTTLSGKSGYQRMTDKTFHTWTFRVGNGFIEVLIDSFLITSTPYPNPVVFNASLWLSSNSSIDKLSGTITDLTFAPTFLKLKKELPQPMQVLDNRNLPAGLVKGIEGDWDWSGVKSCYDQLLDASRLPQLTFLPSMPKIRPMFDFLKAGGEDHGVPIDSAIKAGSMIAKLLSDKFNCDFRVIGNTTDFMSYKDQPNSPHGKFNNTMITMANANPLYELRVDCSLSHLMPIGGFTPIYTAQIQAMYPNEPITTFDGMREILFIHYSTIQDRLDMPITTALVDNEYFNNWLDTVKYNNNTACRQAKEASGLTWWNYCSSQYTKAMNRMYDGIRRACPGINVFEYDVNALDGCNNYYFPKFQYRVGLNTNGEGSDQLYPREMINVLSGGLTSGDKRGLLRYMMWSKAEQIKVGHKFTAPFYGVGYLGNPDFDINVTTTIGLETFVTATGSPTGWPALFVDGGNNPNPKSYAYQMYSLPIAQASLARVWDIIMDGDLIQGDRNQSWQCFSKPTYTWWFGNYEVAVAVMKKGTRYAITTLATSMTNLKTGVELKKVGGITLNGLYIPLEARAQSSCYEYDSTKPIETGVNPKVVNSWVKVGTIENW